MAAAQQLSFRTYDQADGLTNPTVSCLLQDRTGYIVACTEHGIYVYDGRRFLNLGPRQGLPDGGVAHDLVFTADGRIVVRYSPRIFVSQQPLGLSTPPAALTFRPARSDVGLVANESNKQIVPWSGGAIFVSKGRLYYLDPGSGAAQPTIRTTVGLLQQPDGQLQGPTPIAAQGATLWVALSDHRICALDRTSRRCLGQQQGLPDDKWAAFLPLGKTHLLARSMHLLADMDFDTGRVQVTSLPDQGGRYLDEPIELLLARTPTGQILTQSADGLMIRTEGGWKMLTAANGVPPSTILSILSDHDKDLWLGLIGHGALRALGYGLWENRDHRDGLSGDLVWQMSRQPHGPLWVATDGGIDAIGPTGTAPVLRRHYDMPAFALLAGKFDHIWRSHGNDGVLCITARTGEVRRFPLPPVNAILQGSGSRIWFVTEKGVYFIDDGPGEPPPPAPAAGLNGAVTGASVGADGSLWVFRDRQLLHRHADGAVKTLPVTWPQLDFDPIVVAEARPDVVWVGGAGGGLYRLDLDHDRVQAITQFNTPDILSNSIVSLLVDHRGWLWVGTDSGLSVFNGRSWVSANTGTGLIWNDLNQNSLFEDADGSVWMGTSQGLSHLLDPAQLFQHRALQPVVTSVQIGQARFRERAVPWSRQPLLVQFGALNYREDGVIRFRYRLEGVDQGWADTGSGDARYPSLPPGHHRFQVVAYDPLTHQESLPVSILLRMRQPWWLWWPLIAAYGLTAIGAAYVILRLRTRLLVQQRAALQREVDFRTSEIREAQAQDSLTKLLTRGEIQSRLVAALGQANRPTQIVVGLLDIDHFKQINDRFGHLAGDEILQEMGQRLKLALRRGEYAGRYGGEEILIVLEAAEAPRPDRIAVLNAAVCGRPFLVEHETIRVTCSIGVAHEHAHDDWKSLIGRADEALYQAKEQGRDRIIVSLASARRLETG